MSDFSLQLLGMKLGSHLKAKNPQIEKIKPQHIVAQNPLKTVQQMQAKFIISYIMYQKYNKPKGLCFILYF